MAERFTKQQGQHPASIYNYSVMFGQCPAEAGFEPRVDVASLSPHIGALPLGFLAQQPEGGPFVCELSLCLPAGDPPDLTQNRLDRL
jgi:hypothetical protein